MDWAGKDGIDLINFQRQDLLVSALTWRCVVSAMTWQRPRHGWPCYRVFLYRVFLIFFFCPALAVSSEPFFALPFSFQVLRFQPRHWLVFSGNPGASQCLKKRMNHLENGIQCSGLFFFIYINKWTRSA